MSMEKKAPRNNHTKKNFTKSKGNSTQSYTNQLTMKEKANQINTFPKRFLRTLTLSESGRPGKLPSKGLRHSGAPCLLGWLEELFNPHNGANGVTKQPPLKGSGDHRPHGSKNWHQAWSSKLHPKDPLWWKKRTCSCKGYSDFHMHITGTHAGTNRRSHSEHAHMHTCTHQI